MAENYVGVPGCIAVFSKAFIGRKDPECVSLCPTSIEPHKRREPLPIDRPDSQRWVSFSFEMGIQHLSDLRHLFKTPSTPFLPVWLFLDVLADPPAVTHHCVHRFATSTVDRQ